MKSITSVHNSFIREIQNLQSKSKLRKQHGHFVCEGLNEIRLCYLSGFEIEKLVFCEDLIAKEALVQNTGIGDKDTEWIVVNRDVFSKIAYREDVENAIAIVKIKEINLDALKWSDHALFLVAEKVEKPGNIGALLRSADAAGVTAVLLADPICDIYNPNVIRSSVGSVFTVPIVSATTEEIQLFLAKNKVSVFTTFMENATSAWDSNLTEACAIVLGTEHSGLTSQWKKPEYQNINYSMFGKVDSLNISIAAALLIFEAVRQRRS